MEFLSVHCGEKQPPPDLMRAVLHTKCGPIEWSLPNCADALQELLDPANFSESGPWKSVIQGDTLHLVHPEFTYCEGRA